MPSCLNEFHPPTPEQKPFAESNMIQLVKRKPDYLIMPANFDLALEIFSDFCSFSFHFWIESFYLLASFDFLDASQKINTESESYKNL